MSQQYDAIIIGAGVIGACVALEMTRKGFKTLSLDKVGGPGLGSTAGSCAIIRLHYSTPDGVAMAREGHFYWDDWKDYLGFEDEEGLVKYHKTGCIVIKTELNHQLKKVCASLDELQVAWRDMSTADVVDRLPIYEMKSYYPCKLMNDPGFGKPTGDSVDGAIYYEEGGGYISDPAHSAHNVMRAAQNRGAEFRFGAQVVAILQDGGRVKGVKLADGTEIEAKVVVNVGGPHSYLINRMAGVEHKNNIKTRALRQEVCHLPSPEGFDFEKDGLIVSDGDIGIYCRPEVGNHILAGSEDPECDPREEVDPDNYNREFSDQWLIQAYRYAQRLPSLRIPNARQGVVDLYDTSDDWIPIYDKSDLPGFYQAIGTSGNQFKNAPVVGAMMAELIEKCEQGYDHDASPLQFKMHYCGRPVNMATFRRNRTINPNSSFSVIG